MSDRSSQAEVEEIIESFRSEMSAFSESFIHESRTLFEELAESYCPPETSSQFGTLIDVLRQQSGAFTNQVHFQEVGTVLHIGNGVATLSGLSRVCTEEIVLFPTAVQGLVLSLEKGHIDVILLGADEGIRGGDLVKASGKRLRVPVGPGLLGRVLSPLGVPLDGGAPINPSDFRFLERDAPGIIERQPVNQSLHTGLKVIDALLPIGRGQRELILGNRQTGKTTIGVDTIISQKDEDVACIYVAIGQKKSSTLAVIERLRASGAMSHTAVVMSTPDDPPALRYLAPYAGCSIAEYLMEKGKDVLIIYDDLTKHADAYRELSLLLRRPPGREAYPGDIFYLHSRLLERSCRLNDERGGGSLTALPIVEVQQGNIAAFIPTNLISITDGQIVLDTDLFNLGIKPAVDIGKSVSRVGGEAQTSAMRHVASEMRLELAQYEEVARFARFGTEVDEVTQRRIERGQRLREVLTQPPHQPLSLGKQIAILLAFKEGVMDQVPMQSIKVFEEDLLEELVRQHAGLMDQIEGSGELTEETEENLLEIIHGFLVTWKEAKDQG